MLYNFFKRLTDFFVSIVAIIVFLPLMILISVTIKIADPGPILYFGVRTGKDGIPFRIIKFRSMVIDSEQRGGGTTALNDPRIFPFGLFLRRYKLDELPQFINVLLGDMSIVGPRPELPVYTNQYSDEERVILSVRPGITDLSSLHFSSLDEVVGSLNADSVFEKIVLPEKNRLRLQYVRTQSFLGDIRIIIMTVWCIVRKFF